MAIFKDLFPAGSRDHGGHGDHGDHGDHGHGEGRGHDETSMGGRRRSRDEDHGFGRHG
ncbi:hypothetical protein [Streptomyces sp. NPDC056160]|uniref:hypothetical protein n=1 Tax=Streptomyces sp. NPDC056160 TaxID=3345731 RepID=UPI0035E2F8E7